MQPATASVRVFTARRIVLVGLLGALVVVLGLTPLGFVPVPTPAGAATTIHIPVIIAGVMDGPVTGGAVGFLFGLFSYWRALTSPSNPIAARIFSEGLGGVATAFLPRILIGVVAGWAFHLLKLRYGRHLMTAFLALGFGQIVRQFAQNAAALAAKPETAATFTARTFGGWAANPGGVWLTAALVAAAVGVAAWYLLRGESAPAGLAALLGTATNTAGVLSLTVARGILTPGVAWTIAIVQGLPEMIVAILITVAVHRALRVAWRAA